VLLKYHLPCGLNGEQMTKEQRKAVIAGKKERIRKLLSNINATQPEPMVREQPWLAEVLERDRPYRLTAGKETAFTGPS
jgi:hypothetical protein